jgi:hypothetical protein
MAGKVRLGRGARSPRPADVDSPRPTRSPRCRCAPVDVCTRLLAVRPLENRPKLLRNLLDGVSEIGQLGRDERGVRLLRHLMLSDCRPARG